jgi:hypothetical protein
MSSKKASNTTSKKPRMSKSAARADRASGNANDTSRAKALATLNAKPTSKPKGAPTRATKPSRGSKPEGWENDPLENDAALDAALGAKDAAGGAAVPTATTNAKPAKGSPTAKRGGRGAPGGKSAGAGKDAKAKASMPKPTKPKRLSALDAAAKVLAESDRPLRAIDMIEVMRAQGLWTSPGGKTPEATLYAAITREIASKGTDARFQKVDRGMFTSATKSTSGKGA